ncbi:hypothetical protein EBU71_08175 [bacterium]|nr:hypothetical protein [Candidatus Elulimicrobium humile]
MSRLKPGATYIYEQADGITYAREVGAEPGERFEIGRSEGRIDLDEHDLVIAMRRAARTNKAVRKALDRAILVYKMSEEYERENRVKR